MAVEKLLVTRREVGEMLGIPMRTLDRMESRGELPGRIRLGSRMIRYDLRAIRAWRDGGCQPVREEVGLRKSQR